MPFANREKSFLFEDVKTYLSTCEYKVEITGADNIEELTSIHVYDSNNDYVYFAFSPINDLDYIMTISFYQSTDNSEVSLSNYSADGSASNDQYSTHVIGESSKTVKGVDEQRDFLYKQP